MLVENVAKAQFIMSWNQIVRSVAAVIRGNNNLRLVSALMLKRKNSSSLEEVRESFLSLGSKTHTYFNIMGVLEHLSSLP